MKVNYRIGTEKPNRPIKKDDDYTQPGQMPEIYPPIHETPVEGQPDVEKEGE